MPGPEAPREPGPRRADDVDPAGLPDDPSAALIVAPRPLRPSGRRGRGTVAAWLVALAVVAGLGLLAEEPPAPGRSLELTGRDRPTEATPAINDWPWPPRLEPLVRLDSPALADVEITSPGIRVEGTVLARAARIAVSLEARNNRRLEHVLLDVGDPDGGIRPERRPTFDLTFGLPFPRPNGTMWIVVTAYDARGLPLGATRRPFLVGPLLDVGRPAGPIAAGPIAAGPTAPGPFPCRPIAPTRADRC